MASITPSPQSDEEEQVWITMTPLIVAPEKSIPLRSNQEEQIITEKETIDAKNRYSHTVGTILIAQQVPELTNLQWEEQIETQYVGRFSVLATIAFRPDFSSTLIAQNNAHLRAAYERLEQIVRSRDRMRDLPAHLGRHYANLVQGVWIDIFKVLKQMMENAGLLQVRTQSQPGSSSGGSGGAGSSDDGRGSKRGGEPTEPSSRPTKQQRGSETTSSSSDSNAALQQHLSSMKRQTGPPGYLYAGSSSRAPSVVVTRTEVKKNSEIKQAGEGIRQLHLF